MARMIPAAVPNHIRSRAEKTLFPILRDRLDESFTIFHSFNMLTRNRDNKFIDGEIDFLIFSPRLGFLVLEVKGGSIRYDGNEAIWYQNDHMLSMSPFQQAEISKHKLRGFLSNRLGRDMPQISFGHAVCFPDVFSTMDKLPSGAEPEICITSSDLPYIDKSIDDIMESFTGNFGVLSQKDTERILHVLMPHCEYGASLVDRIGYAERDIFALTENQCQVLDFITQHRQALVEGCAGSGKTVMAVKKARELATQGHNVLLLAYNRMISDQLSREVSDLDNATAQSYHKYCRDLLSEAGRLPPDENITDEYWGNILPQRLSELLEEHPVKHDAVIVDEGQDFWVEWWVTITDLLKSEGYFYIFYDPAQNLRRTKMEFPIDGPPFTLTANCRNTKSVFETLKPYAGTEIHLKEEAPAGEKVEEYHLASSRERRKQLSRILHDLVIDQGFERDRIAILGGHSINHTCIGDDPQIGNFKIVEGPMDEPGCVHYHTYMKFKGCEADAVILLDVDQNDERWDSTALYTAISRARHILHIIWADK